MTSSSEQTSTPARHRHRATAACTQCRKSRIRCIFDPESTTCVNCRDSDYVCVYDAKDGRKSRASAKAVETKLMRRINDLERQLKEARATDQDLLPQSQVTPSSQPPPYTSPVSDDENKEPGPVDSPDLVVTKLMPSAIRFDMASGRVRYFGSTTHMNVLARASSNHDIPARRDTHWPVALLVRDLSSETHNYLMDLFWDLHNSVVHLVHAETFSRDQEHGGVEFYSTFLHLTMLATGFRYADKTRGDIRRLALPGYATSTLHEKAKALAKLEIEKPGGIPSIQAFQLLGGLEFCCGDDDTGWLYTGMCFRIIFDAGLHVDPSQLGLPERDVQIRHMVLWACMVTDRLWSLYLGRPTTIKTTDVSPACLSFDFGRMILCRPSWHEKKPTTRVYEALLQMMETISQLCELRGPRAPKSTETYFKMAAIDQQLREWCTGLPRHLQWSLETQKSMPPSYYLLHTQYHAAVILLHRPFVRYSEKSEANVGTHFTSLSRTSCVESAEHIATIFEQYRARFDMAQAYGTAVQHAGTAVTALMGEVILQTDMSQRDKLIERITSLRLAISLMARNYQPAGYMTSVVDQFIRSMQSAGLDKSEFKRRADGEDSGPSGLDTAVGGLAGNSPSQPHHDFVPLSQCRNRMGESFAFTPTCSGSQSPSGLPFLPSSFLEGLIMDDTMFSGLAGVADVNFPWDCPPEHQ